LYGASGDTPVHPDPLPKAEASITTPSPFPDPPRGEYPRTPVLALTKMLIYPDQVEDSSPVNALMVTAGSPSAIPDAEGCP